MPNTSQAVSLSIPNSRRHHKKAILVLAAIAFVFAGCSDDEPPMAPDPSPSILVLPNTPIILIGDSLQFSADLRNISGSVTWSLASASPRTDSLGTISPGGVYHAPTAVTISLHYMIHVIATSVADTSVKGSALVTVPRIIVNLRPGGLESVLPGTWVPFEVSVDFAHDPSYRLLVGNGIDFVEGGDETRGTWIQTGPTSTIYRAPTTQGMIKKYEFIAKSVEDSTRAATSNVTVRAGFMVDVDTLQRQFAPQWSPTSNSLAYVQGEPWKLLVHNLSSTSINQIANVDWGSGTYDGRISWNPAGTRLVFSSLSGGTRAITKVDVLGLADTTFIPAGGGEFFEACYWPTEVSDPESILVSTNTNGRSELRVYPASNLANDPGRLLYAPSGGIEVRSPDAIVIADQVNITAILRGSSINQVMTMIENGGSPIIVASGSGKRTYPHWTPQGFFTPTVTFFWDVTKTAHRIVRFGTGDPTNIPRIYSEFFPEHSGDLSIQEQHALSRQGPDGKHHLWVVEFPPASFQGVPALEERELERMGIRGALSPNSWRRWIGNDYDFVRVTGSSH